MSDLAHFYAATWRQGAPMLLVPVMMWLAAMIGHAFS